jgi:ferredoxin
MTQRFEIHVEASDLSFSCGEEERLLHAMQAQGIASIPVGCKGGGCGVCRVHILQGEYETKKMSRNHVSETEEQEGYALSCRVIPKSNLSLRLAPKPASEKAESAA